MVTSLVNVNVNVNQSNMRTFCLFSLCQTSWAANLIAIVERSSPHTKAKTTTATKVSLAVGAGGREQGADVYALVRDRMYLLDTFAAATEINTC